MKVVGHAWNQLAPSIMPFGRHFDTVLDSMINDESRMTPSQAIATTLGIRLNPLDPERIERGYKFRNDRAMSYIRKQYKKELLEAKTSEDVEKSLDRMTNNIYRLMPESFDMESARSKIHRDIVKQIRKESRGK